MKKTGILFFCSSVFGISLLFAYIIQKPYTFSPGRTIKSSQINANFDTIYNEFNGRISGENLSDMLGGVKTLYDIWKYSDFITNDTSLFISDSQIPNKKYVDWKISLINSYPGNYPIQSSDIADWTITETKISNSAKILKTNEVLTLPTVSGNSGKYLKTDGSTLIWDTVVSGGTPGGNNNTVQFNYNGVFTGDDRLTWDSSLAQLTINGELKVNNYIYFDDAGYATFLGYQSGVSSSGTGNTAVGYQALKSVSIGSNNIAIGQQPLYSNTSGANNIAIGLKALYSNTTSSANIAIGFQSLFYSTGDNNTAVGYHSLYSNTTGVSNTAIGRDAGTYTSTSNPNQTTTQSVFVGTNTKSLNNGDTNEIVIGYNAVGQGSNTVVLGNDAITQTYLKGNVGIGVSSVPNILTVQQNSTTDPIADSWTTYPCDREHKDIVSQNISVLDKFKSIPIYKWKKKPLVSDNEVAIEVELKPDTQSETGINIPNKMIITKEFFDKNHQLKEKLKDDISVVVNKFEQKKQELIDRKSKLPKYTTERIGIMIDDPEVPQEILVVDENGNVQGIDLLGWIGYLHSALKEEISKREALEQRVSDLENRILKLENKLK